MKASRFVRKRKLFIGCAFCLVATFLFHAGSAFATARVALVIGNSDYEIIAPLANPRNDARAVAEELRRHQFSVDVVEDADGEELSKALAAFSKVSVGAQIAVIYYAGHGVEIGGANYILPTDAAIQDRDDISSTAVALDDLLENTVGQAAFTMVVLDACRDDPFRANPETRSTASLSRGLARVQPEGDGDVLVMYAAAEGETVSDGQRGGNSPFTTAFLEAMKSPARDVRVMLGAVKDHLQSNVDPASDPYVYSSMGGREVVLNIMSPSPIAPTSARPTLLVDAGGAGDFRSLREAVEVAPEGARIQVLPGVYSGALEVSKSIDIEGFGSADAIILEARDDDVVLWLAPSGSISNMTIRQLGGQANAVRFRGRTTALIEDSNITSAGYEAIWLEQGAAARVAGNRIFDSAAAGVLVSDGATGEIVGNRIYRNAKTGVRVERGAAPLIDGNRITENIAGAIVVYDNAKPTIRRNVIGATPGPALLFLDSSSGEVSDNTIGPGALVGIEAETAGELTISGNVIAEAREDGVLVIAAANARISENQITGVGGNGVRLEAVGSAVLSGNIVDQATASGLVLLGPAQATVTDNSVVGAGAVGLAIEGEVVAEVARNVVSSSLVAGVTIASTGKIIVRENDIVGSTGVGMLVAKGNAPEVLKNKIFNGMAVGVQIDANARFSGNEVKGNRSAGLLINGGDPDLLIDYNTFEGGFSSAIEVIDRAVGEIRGNVLKAHPDGAILVQAGSDPRIIDNKINAGEAGAILVEAAAGVYRANVIEGGPGSSVVFTGDATGLFEDNEVLNSGQAGLVVRGAARPVVRGNTILASLLSGVELTGSELVELSGNLIADGHQSGILVHEGARAKITANCLTNNRIAGLSLRARADVAISRNVVGGGNGRALIADVKATGSFSNNRLAGVETPEANGALDVFGNGPDVKLEAFTCGRATSR